VYGAEVGTETGEGRVKFGTYTRDSAGVDYADQRYYGAGMGRFLTSDPLGMSAANLKAPGSWNRYAYVRGDPINFYNRTGPLPVMTTQVPPTRALRWLLAATEASEQEQYRDACSMVAPCLVAKYTQALPCSGVARR
jgi:RHS repeat-associated protein